MAAYGLLPSSARDAVSSVFAGSQYDFSALEKKFGRKAGVFVQIYKNGELKGSVGFPEPVHTIAKAVVLSAKAAAFEDPRFLPLKQGELKDVKFEVSVLSKPAEIKGSKDSLLKKLKPGKKGCMIRLGPNEGVLLPKETEGMSHEELLDALCQKAGLAPELWQDENAKVYEFTAETYSE
ncbi:AmmeMemoRadiSam system protein A [Candidatus Woesearchaeota archaeon]|nr:AmmeMemoRadiSam system protein A [Candidatus Woesearchaeota archaeon]